MSSGARRRRTDADACDDHVEWATREWPDLDPEVEEIVTRISGIERRLSRSAAETLADLDLNHNEFKVLMRLIRGPRTHGDITRELLVSTGTMTNRLDRLEQAGLLRRRPDPADRRGVLVELTAQGRARLDRYVGLQGGLERQLLSRLEAPDKHTLAGLLRKLDASVTAEAEAAAGTRSRRARRAG